MPEETQENGHKKPFSYPHRPKMGKEPTSEGLIRAFFKQIFEKSLRKSKNVVSLQQKQKHHGMEKNLYNAECSNNEALEADIRTIAERENLVLSKSNNGDILAAFYDFAEAEEIASRYNLRLGLFTRKDGQDTWRYLNDAFEPMTITEENYTDDYRIYRPSQKDDMLDELRDWINDVDTFEEAMAIMEQQAEIYKALEDAKDDEIVLTVNGNYSETMKRECMEFHFDTKHWLIALYSEDEGRI